MRDPGSALCWEKSIQAKARRYFQYLYIPLAIITAGLVAFGLAVVAFMPHGGMLPFLGIGITETEVSSISFLFDVLGIVSVAPLVIALLRRIEPGYRRYNEASIEVIDEVANQLNLSTDTRQKMLNIVTAELSPCTSPSLKDACKNGLIQASAKLAKIVSDLPASS